MAFQFNPEKQAPVPEMAPPRERVSTFTVCILLGFLLLMTLIFAWGPLTSAVKLSWGRKHAREARAALSGNDLSGAVPRIMEARRWAPDDVEVISAVIEYLKLTNSDPGTLAQQLKLLATKQPLTEEQEALLGKSLITARKTVEARGVYEKMTARSGSSATSLDLLASVLSAEGHKAEAEEIVRRSNRQRTDSPEARLQLAIEDRNHIFPEVRNWARAELWEIAQMDGDVGLKAVVQLSHDPDLTVAEAQRLLPLADQHPHQNLFSHLSVMSALMRLQPEQREAILDAETTRFKDEKEGRLVDFAQWLSAEKQHSRLLKLLPRKLVAKSRELYPLLAEALVAEERWQELREMLTSQPPPVSNALAGIWLAEVESHLQPDLKETRRLLQNSIDFAKHDNNAAALFAAGVLAEKLSLVEIAVQCYSAAAINDSESSIKLLQKAAEMAQLQKDPLAMLEIARKLHELRPSSALFADRFDYLRLILGVEMENVDLQQTRPAGNSEIVLNHMPPELLRALAAYRLGDQQGLAANLQSLPKDMSSLSAGQRAVIAGLLALSGGSARAYQIAERVPEKLLLDEERQFLNRAK